MRHLFDIDSPLMGFLFKVFDSIALSLIWVLFSLPLVTLGASTTALFTTVRKCLHKDGGHLLCTFWDAFRENFKTATACWLVILAALAVLILDAGVFRAMLARGDAMGNLYWVILAAFAVAITWATYVFAYCARCNGTVKETLTIPALLMLYHPLRAIWVFLPLLAWAVLAFIAPGLAILLPAPLCWFGSRTIEKVFRLYMRPEDLERE